MAKTPLKTREDYCRRVASRRGLLFTKPDVRDSQATGHSTYILTDGAKKATPYTDLAEVEERLGIKSRNR